MIYYGSGIPADLLTKLGALWAAHPAKMVVAPDVSEKFPKNRVIVTSWQR